MLEKLSSLTGLERFVERFTHAMEDGYKGGAEVMFKGTKSKPWTKAMDYNIKRSHFSSQKNNDTILTRILYSFSLVQIYGTNQWAKVSKELNVMNLGLIKNGKQCRTRWLHHLDPNIKTVAFSVEEVGLHPHIRIPDLTLFAAR